MALRKIITINEELCNGCGNCITGCAEGALQLVNGKAKLVKESFCDGFGDCIGTCPTGALKIEERESEEFCLDSTYKHVKGIRGKEAAEKMKASFGKHLQEQSVSVPCGCPSTMMRFKQEQEQKPKQSVDLTSQSFPTVFKSEITQWSLQLHLIQPQSPFLHERELVLLSTCSSVTSPDVHWRFVRGRAVAIACPKLDRTEGYIEKLADILRLNNIPKLIILRMEVPCCSGLIAIVKNALKEAGEIDTIVEEVVMNLDGEIISSKIIF